MKRFDVSSYLTEMGMWQLLRKITGRQNEPKRFLLAKLLGKKSYVDLLDTFSEEDKQLCEMLAGPNGHTIYKMLLAQRGLEDQDYVPKEWHRDSDGRRGNPETALL